MARRNKRKKTERLLLAEYFEGHNPYRLAAEMCQWANGKSAKESHDVRAVVIVPYETMYAGILFYRDDYCDTAAHPT